jgi:uncharacterized protein YbbK (DUF523 family)
MARRSPPREIRIGVSACLLGERVRWDGGHERSAAVAALGRRFALVPVCPEVEAGLGVPRPPIRLERRRSGVRLVDPASGADHTAAMRRWARSQVAVLRRLGIAGFVFKERSPSCGLERIEVTGARGARRDGTGLFAATLRAAMPRLPLVEAERLLDAAARRRFVEGVLAYGRKGTRPSPKGVAAAGEPPSSRLVP